MKKILIAWLLIFALCLLSGCTSIDEGTVISKQHSPAHTSYQPYVMIINKHTMIIPRYIHHPDSWSILVENEEGKEWWNVSEGYYRKVDIGDYVDRTNKSK